MHAVAIVSSSMRARLRHSLRCGFNSDVALDSRMKSMSKPWSTLSWTVAIVRAMRTMKKYLVFNVLCRTFGEGRMDRVDDCAADAGRFFDRDFYGHSGSP